MTIDSKILFSQQNLRVVLVGCGAISRLFYAPALLTLASSEKLSISYLVDPNPKRLSELSVFFPSAVKIDNINLFQSFEADLAIVASPQRFHAEQATKLLAQGIHVLCEKPLASNLAEAESMVQIASQNKRLLAVGLFRRFFPITEFVRDLISGQDLGSPLRFFWSEGGEFNWPAASPSFFQKESSTGGVFADLGAHVLDLLLYWFGIVEDFNYRDDYMGGLEANASLDLRFQNGVTGKLRLSRDTSIPNSVWIEFARGFLYFHGGSACDVTLQLKHSNLSAKSTLHLKPKNTSPMDFSSSQPSQSYAQSFTEQIRNFSSAIRGQEPLRMPASEALISIALIERCYKQRKLMAMPWMDETELLAAQVLAS